MTHTKTILVYCSNSQGFCCECSASAVYSSTIGSGSTTTSRANLNCNLFSGGLFLEGVPGSAHCLRFADLYYAVCILALSYLFYCPVVIICHLGIVLEANSQIALSLTASASASRMQCGSAQLNCLAQPSDLCPCTDTFSPTTSLADSLKLKNVCARR